MSSGMAQLVARKIFDKYPDLPNAFTKLGCVSGQWPQGIREEWTSSQHCQALECASVIRLVLGRISADSLWIETSPVAAAQGLRQ